MYEVAVVGAAGFLGGAIMRAFAQTGNTAVGFTLANPMLADGVVAPDARGVRTVVWCASRINPRLAAERPHLIDADRADLDRALCEFATWERPPRILIFSSGGTVYGPPATPPFVEDPDPDPVNDYGLAKLRIERHVRESGLDSVVLRASNAYGPGQVPAPGQGVLAHWMSAVMSGERVHLYGEPSATRDYIYVDDVARAVVAAHAAQTAPPIVNVGSGTATSLHDLVDALRRVVAPRTVEVVEHGARDTDTLHSVLDVSLARAALGWQAEVDILRGVELMWQWRLTQ